MAIKAEFEGLFIDVKWFRAMDLKQGDKVSMHSHKSYEFHIVKNGACTVEKGYII